MLTAYPALKVKGLLRQYNQDFRVIENLGYIPSGEGEHVLLWVEKNGANTEWVAKQIAKFAGLSVRDIGFAGVKDRHAITQQWFSVWIKNKPEPDWHNLQDKEFVVLNATRHTRKIKRGNLKGNYFEITLRDLQYENSAEIIKDTLQQRVDLIMQQGVPNYFGEQRFGHDGNNIKKANAWFAGEHNPKRSERAWLLSSARSCIFNQVLEKRIKEKTWQTVLPDDIMMLSGTQSIFVVDDSALAQTRLIEKDIHITGPLYGGELIKQDNIESQTRQAIEYQVYTDNAVLCDGLDKKQMRAERRSLRILPEKMQFELDEKQNSLKVYFYLPAGAYATTVLKEFVEYS